MKIRAITAGMTVNLKMLDRHIAGISQFLQAARASYRDQGIAVQSLRLTIQSWTQLADKYRANNCLRMIREIEEACQHHKIDFLSVGQACTSESINTIPDIIANTQRTTACAIISDNKTGVNFKLIKSAAAAVSAIARNTSQGYGNFRFANIVNCPPGIPFYPASYHRGGRWFALGLECSDLVHKAFAAGPKHAKKNLKDIFLKTARVLSYRAQKLARHYQISFRGIDLSPAPSLSKKDSIVYAFEKISANPFGASGTLAVAGMLTDVLHKLPVKKCGFSGLMLPVLEDHGLAKLYGEGRLSLGDLLTISAVCGTGLDCIPLPGIVTSQCLATILSDIATMSLKLGKPLSARLLPVPGKKAGERTQFKSPYLIDCIIPPLTM